MIPKPNKDKTLVSNYRPISLLNNYIKLYAKIIANRLLPLLPRIISLDQTGFTPGREAKDNTIKAIHVQHWLIKSKSPGFFLSLDAEKAFDRIAWDYMLDVLKSLGIQDRMLGFINLLYSYPTARIKVNGVLSEAFSLSNGTRQGCPLSPIIFILILEPFLCRLRENVDISGVKIISTAYKLAAFADDILLFLTNPIITIPNLLKDFSMFRTISNFKINFSKSKALNISFPLTR